MPAESNRDLTEWIHQNTDKLRTLAVSEYQADWIAEAFLESEGIPVEPDGPTVESEGPTVEATTPSQARRQDA